MRTLAVGGKGGIPSSSAILADDSESILLRSGSISGVYSKGSRRSGEPGAPPTNERDGDDWKGKDVNG